MIKGPLEPHCNDSAHTNARSKVHIFSEITTTIRASCFQFYSFTASTYFIYSIEVIFHWISVVVICISVLLYSVCYSFLSAHKSISVAKSYSINPPIDFQCMDKVMLHASLVFNGIGRQLHHLTTMEQRH